MYIRYFSNSVRRQVSAISCNILWALFEVCASILYLVFILKDKSDLHASAFFFLNVNTLP